jgi:hypothetical protein
MPGIDEIRERRREIPKRGPMKAPKTPDVGSDIKIPEIGGIISEIDDLLKRKVPKYDPCIC